MYHKESYDLGRFQGLFNHCTASIFSRAAKRKTVLDAYAVDFCIPAETAYEEPQKGYGFHREYWKKLSAGINSRSASRSRGSAKQTATVKSASARTAIATSADRSTESIRPATGAG